MDQHCPGKLMDFRAPDENTDLFSMFEGEGIHDFCPRLASTPQQGLALPSPTSSLYPGGLMNLSYSCSPLTTSTVNSLSSFNHLSTPSHRDLLDVIEATEHATVPSSRSMFSYGSAPLPQDSFSSQVSHANRYAQPVLTSMHAPCSSSYHDPRYMYPSGVGIMTLPSPTAKPELQPEISSHCNINLRSAHSNITLASSHSNAHLANVRYVRPSNMCTEGFVIPETPKSVSAWVNRETLPKMLTSQNCPRSEVEGLPVYNEHTPPPSANAEVDLGSILSGLKHNHRDSKTGNRKKSSRENEGPLGMFKWTDNCFLEPLHFESNFSDFCDDNALDYMQRRPLSEVQVPEGGNALNDPNSQLHSSLNQLQMLSLRDLGRKYHSDTSDDSGLFSQRTYSRDSESSRSRDRVITTSSRQFTSDNSKISSSSGDFTSDNSNTSGFHEQPLIPKSKATQGSHCQSKEPNSKSCPNTPSLKDILTTENSPKRRGSTGIVTGSERSGLGLEESCSPAKESVKVQRKPETPIRSASPGDPKFRGVTLQMRTKVETDDHVQLSIKAFFNCRKASRSSTRKSPARKSPPELRRVRHNSTSSSDSDFGVELFPEKKRRTNTIGKQCASCATKTTPLWRDAEDGTPLCNACGIRYKKYRMRCSRCWHIPRKETKANLECSSCGEPLRISLFRGKHWKN